MAKTIDLIGGIAALLVAGSGINFMIYMALLLFVLVPMGNAIFNKLTIENKRGC